MIASALNDLDGLISWMSLSDRIREAMGTMSAAELARQAKVSPASVTFWLDGSTKTLKYETARLVEAATGYRAEWIVKGTLPKKAEPSPQPSIPSFSRAAPAPSGGLQPILAWEHEEDLPPGEFVMIPRLNIHLSAGHGRDQVEIEFTKALPQAFRAEWIRERRLKPNKLAAMTASGNSMEPGICDGDSLLIDTSETSVTDGKVYALWYDGGERVKRLFRLPGGGLRIKSDNPEHGTIELGPDYGGHVRIIGRVVHRSGTGGL
jgi:phage repressor protein C with HTH and peptisase S24 domain